MSSISPRDRPREIGWEAPLRATWALVALLVAVHVGSAVHQMVTHDVSWSRALLFGRDVRFRVAVGGQYRVLVESGQAWRLVTSTLLHADALHLAVNAVAIASLGRLLEPWVGALRWASWFAIGAVGGSVASQLAGVTQSDGASGGAFALLGAALVLGARLRGELEPSDARLMGPVLWGFTALNAVLSVVLPFIDAVGHLGGLAVGLLLGAGHAWGRRTWAGHALDASVLLTAAAACAYGVSTGLR